MYLPLFVMVDSLAPSVCQEITVRMMDKINCHEILTKYDKNAKYKNSYFNMICARTYNLEH